MAVVTGGWHEVDFFRISGEAWDGGVRRLGLILSERYCMRVNIVVNPGGHTDTRMV